MTRISLMLFFAIGLVICQNKYLEGNWINQMGSTVELTTSNGILSGFYISPNAGDAGNTSYVLSGTYYDDSDSSSFGFTVSWINSADDNLNTTSVWAGHIMKGNEDDSYILRTYWLMIESTPWVYAWESTMMGQDTFFRQDDNGEGFDDIVSEISNGDLINSESGSNDSLKNWSIGLLTVTVCVSFMIILALVTILILVKKGRISLNAYQNID
mmetsp:Transcript_23345/g.39867  ORF Transcript_23345/g.39867 Transcript_23345/m.39867 type:complete len:213 (+) Transcript_23345:45-683(+)